MTKMNCSTNGIYDSATMAMGLLIQLMEAGIGDFQEKSIDKMAEEAVKGAEVIRQFITNPDPKPILLNGESNDQN